MRLLSFSASRKESWGAVAGDGVIDHRKALEEKYAGLKTSLPAWTTPCDNAARGLFLPGGELR